MKDYWDSSALVETLFNLPLRQRLKRDGGKTRLHAFAEVFSTMTGGRLGVRYDADDATKKLEEMSADLELVELDRAAVFSAFKQARRRGVRGGQVHDLLHAVAADKSGAKRLLTTDQNDFKTLVDTVEVEQI